MWGVSLFSPSSKSPVFQNSLQIFIKVDQLDFFFRLLYGIFFKCILKIVTNDSSKGNNLDFLNFFAD